MPPTPPNRPFFETLAIGGVGLIGAAIALHARRLGIAKRIIGHGRNASRLEEARGQGILDDAVTDAKALREADLVIVCTPVDRIVADVREIAAATDERTLITDAGSVKAAICEPLAGLPRFVGSHPLAGSEKKGFEHAHEVSFQKRVCVVTPVGDSRRDAVEAIASFWKAIGMEVVHLTPQMHDAALARTSHFPHLAAYALAALLQDGDEQFAASGFRDATRIAASDPGLWTAITAMNRDAVRRTLKTYVSSLTRIDELLAVGDFPAVQQVLEAARNRRIHLDDARRAD